MTEKYKKLSNKELIKETDKIIKQNKKFLKETNEFLKEGMNNEKNN